MGNCIQNVGKLHAVCVLGFFFVYCTGSRPDEHEDRRSAVGKLDDGDGQSGEILTRRRLFWAFGPAGALQ